jgi:hypothetical protein
MDIGSRPGPRPLTLRILRLTNSDELADTFPVGERQFEYVEQLLSRRFEEPVETILGSNWPSERQPDRVAELVERHEPDIVLLTLSDFAVNFHSIPMRLRRKYGPLGSKISNALIQAGSHPTLGRSRAARWARVVGQRFIKGEAFIEPDELVAITEETLRPVLRTEGIVAAIHGSCFVWGSEEWGEWDYLAARREETATRMRELVKRLHIHHIDYDAPFSAAETIRMAASDLLHSSWLSRAFLASVDELFLASAICEQRGLPAPDSALTERMETLRRDERSPFYDQISDDDLEFLRPIISRIQLVSSLGTATRLS